MQKNKNLFTGIIIGMCIVTVPLILMGSTTLNYDDGIGRYQISNTGIGKSESEKIYEVIIDTKTGRVVSRKKVNHTLYY
ncbi:MAG: hypothetical protein CMP51_01870 [Flavobacteriales bacterium]|nr:hypothetical protein [Flavobacteriales bacterium]|tara:strand:+ start:113 stop:349 length:237 start_codon:yes stop_codon:yes gene_type:complete